MEHPLNLDSFLWYDGLLYWINLMTISHTNSRKKLEELLDNQVWNQTEPNEKQQDY